MIKRDKSYEGDRPLLYLVATPVGNIKDFTYRAIEILSSVDMVACEDTRNTKKLLSFYNINKPLFSLHEHNEISASLTLIEKINAGAKVAYVSDAGYPLISDPGQLLVKECIKQDIKVSVIPGGNAMLLGLCGSNITTSHFLFYGFLSSKPSERNKQLDSLVKVKDTIIFYEAPHRIKDTLKALHTHLGDRNICIARELSKIHEEYIRMNLSELDELDTETLKGEMVITVEGNQDKDEMDEKDIVKLIKQELEAHQLKDKEIAKKLSEEYHLAKNQIYDLILKIKNGN